MNQPKETLLCPVCKSGISKETVIPIYTKGNSEDPRYGIAYIDIPIGIKEKKRFQRDQQGRDKVQFRTKISTLEDLEVSLEEEEMVEGKTEGL